MNHDLTPYEEPTLKEYETLDQSTLEERLSQFIQNLLEHNFAKLTNMIYRHDVNEAKFNRALEEPSLKLQANAIARLVVERELQKIETRKKYSNNKNLPL
jgi:hypothetical protein